MTVVAVDPSVFVGSEREHHLPRDAPHIAVVVSLRFPGIGGESLELMTRFTTVAFDALRESGARPVLIDSSADLRADPREVIDHHDGVLFLGGGDVDPNLYGADAPAPNSYGVDRRADEFCLDLLRCAIEADITTLAICRGSQLLNVVSGGSLIPDIEPFELHRGGPGHPLFLDEEITLVDDTRISRILGRQRVTVRSGHHQAVRSLGEGLRVSAIADDGVIEGTERIDRRWIVGVQWHPEDSDGDAEDRRKLFGAFVQECERSRSAMSA